MKTGIKFLRRDSKEIKTEITEKELPGCHHHSLLSSVKQLITLILSIILISGCSEIIPDEPDPDDNPEYEKTSVHGFDILVSTDITWDETLYNSYSFFKKRVNDLLTFIPDSVLGRLRAVPLRIENNNSGPVIEYVVSTTEENAGSVIINDLAGYYSQSVTNQPGLLVRCLAQLYYHQYLYRYDGEISSAWDEAVQSGKYEMVDYYDGSAIYKKKAAAAEGETEYFTELSEAYLTRNDYFPFDYHDLRSFDNTGFSLMESIWGKRELGQYARYRMHGFDVMVHNDNVTLPITEEALLYLADKLEEMTTLYPDKFVQLMQRRRVWIEPSGNGGAVYHPGREWLIQNGYTIEKYRCVEIVNMHNFLEWSQGNQPMVMVHEMAHLYHDQAYGFEHAKIKNVYEAAYRSGRYHSVAYRQMNGEIVYGREAYAMTNQQEYFAEITEAYFGQNDYYPFDRKDLQEFDPAGFALLEEIWDPKNFRE